MGPDSEQGDASRHGSFHRDRAVGIEHRSGDPRRHTKGVRSPVRVAGLHQIGNTLHLFTESLQGSNLRTKNRAFPGTEGTAILGWPATPVTAPASGATSGTKRAFDTIRTTPYRDKLQ